MFQAPALFSRFMSALTPGADTRNFAPCPGYVEFTPYGFLSSNYLAYIGGRASGSVTNLPEGTRITAFQNGDVIAEAATGHLVQIDGQGRVVVVRILKQDIPEGITGQPESLAAVLSTGEENGAAVTRVLDVLKVTVGSGGVSVRFPNRTVVNLPVKNAGKTAGHTQFRG